MTDEIQSFGTIWFRCKPGVSKKEMNAIAEKFVKENDKIEGANFYELESREEGLQMINRLTKSLDLGKRLKFRRDRDILEHI